MKVIIAGSRSLLPSIHKIQEYVDRSGFEITELVNGMCPDGIDLRAREWADFMGIPVIPFPADWEGAREKLGTHKPAGMIRNAAMADYSEALILIWDGLSPGSASMKALSLRKGIPIFEVILNKRKRSN